MHGSIESLRRAAVRPGVVTAVSREELEQTPQWHEAFSAGRKDRRYYELVEDTIRDGFDYGYLTIKDSTGRVCAIQPFFILDQDLAAGTSRTISAPIDFVRRLWPRFLRMRTLMVGCSAGEGHLDGEEASQPDTAEILSSSITDLARDRRASLVVLKEFPACYREALQCFLNGGFTRVPSMPMTKLSIEYANFEQYLQKVISPKTRGKLRRKFRAAERATPPLEMTVLSDVTPVIDEIYPLYMQVYERSKLHFEKLTKEFLCGLGRHMPDKTRFFMWRQGERIVAFSLCLVHGDGIYSEYIGLDYNVAFDLHLYYLVFRDTVEWAIANGYKWFRSSSLNYDPKFHLRQSLDPLDLYVKHTSPLANMILRRVLPLMAPTRYDETLPKFPNYKDLWG
jgi:hypothetical protein